MPSGWTKERQIANPEAWEKAKQGMSKTWRKKGCVSAFKGKHHTEESKKIIREKRKKQIFTPEHCQKISESNSFEKHWNWKGDAVGYFGVHSWISKKLGKPKKCQNCLTETAKTYQWANISKKYKRELSDWVRLCPSCHIRYDRFGLEINIKPLLGVG